MANIKVVSREEFTGFHWQPVSNYKFAELDSFCQLVLQELSTACMHGPIALIKSGDAFRPVAVQGLLPSSNLLVGRNGAWMGGYVPSPYRGYPFLILKGADNANVLAVDLDSGLIHNGPEGEAFFESDGEPGGKVREVMNFLAHVQGNREQTGLVCQLLEKLELIEPWPIVIARGESEQKIEGYFRISEGRFNSLDAGQLAALRDAGAFQLIFPQLLSMQHLPSFIRMTLAREAAAIKAPSIEESLFAGHGIISFDGL